MPFSKAEAITRSIRECCIHLDALYDALRHDVGITAAMRAVLEALYEHGTQTVPAPKKLPGSISRRWRTSCSRIN
jgi:hypothetical protein